MLAFPTLRVKKRLNLAIILGLLYSIFWKKNLKVFLFSFMPVEPLLFVLNNEGIEITFLSSFSFFINITHFISKWF